MEPARLNTYLADRGIASRRGADALIAAGKVMVNGEVATLGMKVSEQDEVRVEGDLIMKAPERLRYILLYKPVGYITTTDRRLPDNIMDLVDDVGERIVPVGRLDVESSGLILMTNDGEFANTLTHPRYGKEKTYVVDVDVPLQEEHLQAWREGIQLDDGMTRPADIHQLGASAFEIVLREGRNRQIRRMCAAFGYTVKSLVRTNIGSLEIGTLRPGKWRDLTKQEVKLFMQAQKA